MFYVTIGNDWCSVVPQLWINIDQKLCMWPTHDINISKAIKKLLPPQASWESIPCRYLLGPYESFEEAKSKEKDAEFVSSDDAKIKALQNKENILPLKRKKKPKLYDSFNEIESSDADSIPKKKFQNVPTTLEKSFNDKPTLKQKKVVPNAPSNYKIDIDNKNSNIDITKKDNTSFGQLEQNQCSLSQCSFDIDKSQSLNDSDYDYFSQKEESFQDNIQKDSPKNIQRDEYLERYLTKIKTPNTTLSNMKEKQSVPVIRHIDYNPNFNINKGMKHESYKRKNYSALQIQEHVKQKYKETEIINEKEALNKGENAQEGSMMNRRILDIALVMNRKLDSILAFHDEQNPSTSANCVLDLLPNVPLNSMEDFKKFCNDLNENEELRKQFQRKIRNIGGKSAENHLINCLVTTLTNEFAKQLTWEGQRQTEGIKNTAFANIIMGTISSMYNSSNYYNLKNKFSEWLRRAGDRYRYQLKKLENHT